MDRDHRRVLHTRRAAFDGRCKVHNGRRPASEIETHRDQTPRQIDSIMLTRIAKDFRWEMAHRLPEHEGGCRNVHGHSYRMWVEISGEPQANGMVLDYFEISAIVDPM